MKFNPIPLITVCLLVSISAISQDDSRYQLRLQSGTFIPEKNITIEKISTINQRAVVSSGKSFIVIQFEQLPADADKQRLQRSGIELIDYVSGNAYTAIINGSLRTETLQQSKVRAVIPMTASMKMHPALLKSVLPAYAIKVIGTIDVWISFPKVFSFASVSAELSSRNFEINNSLYDRYRIIGLRIPQQRLQELASLAFIDYVQPAPPEEQMLNDKSRSNARANVITSSLGRNLSGEGVVIGIGDNGDPATHPDFTGRFINRHAGGAGAHGLHVMGTAAGGGVMNEKYTGFAPKATIVAQMNSAIIRSLPVYVQDHGMVITNNSYGLIVDDCNNFGAYDLTSRVLDQQAFDLPNLENVFAAGNSGLFGLTNCTYYANGYGTVLSGFQSAKNAITVGNTTENDSIHYVSSRGPVRDGRIKPDITAQGRNVWSAGFGSYWPNTGTSMAAPAVSGGLALLYQRYRQLHGNANPTNALMKALLLNGATDLGKDGPDYTYGFGWMNLLRSVIMLENNTYYNATIATGGTNNQVITVPANTAMLKVMLYWNDPAGSPMSIPALVNDLDLEVIDPGNPSNPYLPFILDTLPSNILQPATTGADHINNVEQVVLQNPPAGNYTIRVKGTSITQNSPQEFFVVYDTIPVSTTLTYPIGGEKFVPGDSIYISWDAWGGPANTFTLEYNNGSGWTTINAAVHDTARQYKFFIPNTDTTDVAQVRVTRNGTGMVSTSGNFTILGTSPLGLLHPNTQCESYLAFNWFKIPKATDYEVMILRGSEMVSVAIITDTAYTFSGLSKDSVYWVTMRPRLNGNPGRRSQAISWQPNTGLCMGAMSDNDIKIDSITSPAVSGRLLTSNALLAAHPITVRLK
ncbi:MAG TPA: S8 family serine peptidase, partial [Chitinophagaceae bacterium]|nr:S8 family serine peptidase [Chitinophagaceae bacterium]